MGNLDFTKFKVFESEALPTHTLFKFHFLIRVLYPTNLHSFQEPVKHGTSYLRPLSLSHTACVFSYLTPTNLISSLSLLNLSSSSFVGGFAIDLMAFHQHYILKKIKSLLYWTTFLVSYITTCARVLVSYRDTHTKRSP